jgi:hypothetical protein
LQRRRGGVQVTPDRRQRDVQQRVVEHLDQENRRETDHRRPDGSQGLGRLGGNGLSHGNSLTLVEWNVVPI